MALSAKWRDTLTLIAVFALLLGGLFVYTGNWPPAVIVESGSMMHADDEVSYGRFGTIDPGDLVLVKGVDSLDDITTRADGGRDRYGAPGDVIVYYRANDRSDTPIIHRAVAYVEVEGGEYFVRWADGVPCEGGATAIERDGRAWCRYGTEGILIPSLGVRGSLSARADGQGYRPTSNGILTKGDNPSTNTAIDQITMPGANRPIPLEWIEGKGRAELPWLGLIKLSLAGKPNEPSPPASWVKIGSAYAPKDLWVMLGVTLFVLVGIPLLYDGYKAIDQRRRAHAPAPPAPSHLAATPESPTSIRLSWDAIGVAEPPVHFRVYRDDGLAGSTSDTSFLDNGLEPGREYAYHVTAADAAGEDGPRSLIVRARTPLADAEPAPDAETPDGAGAGAEA